MRRSRWGAMTMTEEAKKIVEGLRICSISSLKCDDCPVHVPKKSCQNDLDAADLIERLSSELELARQENTGLSIMLTAAQSAAETFRRERDALLSDLKEAAKMDCSTCKDYAPENGWCEESNFVCRDCIRKDCPCMTCEFASNWQCRGVKTDNEAGD